MTPFLDPCRARLLAPELGEGKPQVNDRALLAAALAAGFGSYVQFHRMFRGRFGKAPREHRFEQRVAPPSEDGPGPRQPTHPLSTSRRRLARERRRLLR